MGRTSRG